MAGNESAYRDRPAWLSIFHPGPSLATTAAAVLFAFALRVPLSYWGFVLKAIAVPMLLVQLSISVLNDWADRERDHRSGRRSPVAAGMVAPGPALGLALLLGAAAIGWSLAVRDGMAGTGLLTLGLLAGYAYDLRFKPTPLSFLPFAVAFPLLLVWLGAVLGYGPPAGLAFLAGVPLATAIHLADAVPDATGDARAGIRTLAVALGPRRATLLSAGGLVLGSALLAAFSLRVHPVMAPLILLVGAGAGAAFVFGRSSRWIVAGGAAIAVTAWLASGGW